MRSLQGMAALAAAVAIAGLTSAVPADASALAATVQWKATFSHAGGNDTAGANVVSPDGNTVYVTGEAETPNDTGFGKTIAYNAATGAVVWQARYSPHTYYFSGFNSIALSPNGTTVFVTGWTGDANGPPGTYEVIVAYNAATGAELWQATGPQHGPRIRPSYEYPGPIFAPAVVSSDSSTLFVTTPAGVILLTRLINSNDEQHSLIIVTGVLSVIVRLTQRPQIPSQVVSRAQRAGMIFT